MREGVRRGRREKKGRHEMRGRNEGEARQAREDMRRGDWKQQGEGSVNTATKCCAFNQSRPSQCTCTVRRTEENSSMQWPSGCLHRNVRHREMNTLLARTMHLAFKQAVPLVVKMYIDSSLWSHRRTLLASWTRRENAVRTVCEAGTSEGKQASE